MGDVDPSFSTIPADVYTLRINKMVPKTYEGKKDPSQSFQVVKGDFTVIDHPDYAGRRLFETFWLNHGWSTKALRRISDNTGIPQEPGAGTFEAWLERLSTEQPSFKVPVTVREGDPPENAITWRDVKPV